MPKKGKKKAGRQREVDPTSIYNSENGQSDYKYVPECMYFYYVRPGSAGFNVLNYYYTNDAKPILDPVEAIRYLTNNARYKSGLQNPPPCGKDCEFMVWSRISYVAFLIDDPTYEFIPGNALTFDDTKGLPNHCFFDGEDQMVELWTKEKRSAVWCINRMEDEDGVALGKVCEFFWPTLQTEPHLPRYPDSGGTNMGPPIGPP